MVYEGESFLIFRRSRVPPAPRGEGATSYVSVIATGTWLWRIEPLSRLALILSSGSAAKRMRQ